eukprot:824929-Rhodomonas_salina.1
MTARILVRAASSSPGEDNNRRHSTVCTSRRQYALFCEQFSCNSCKDVEDANAATQSHLGDEPGTRVNKRKRLVVRRGRRLEKWRNSSGHGTVTADGGP